jgi:hypothetical protein
MPTSKAKLEPWQWGAIVMALGVTPFLLACLAEALGIAPTGSNDGCGLVAFAVAVTPIGLLLFLVGCCIGRRRPRA